MNKKEIRKCVNSLKKQAVDKILKDRDFLEKWFISEDDKLCTEFIADSLSDYGLKHYTNYCNRDGKSIVKNVKWFTEEGELLLFVQILNINKDKDKNGQNCRS